MILTTSGGFYRYDLKDLIQVTDFYREVPVIRFLGKADKVSDRFGEKLNEVFVQDALAGLGISENPSICWRPKGIAMSSTLPPPIGGRWTGE